MRKLIITGVMLFSAVISYSQETPFKLELYKATYKNGKLSFNLRMHNNSNDTLRIIDGGAFRFLNNVGDIKPDEMGLKEFPFQISSTGLVVCESGIQKNTTTYPDKIRRNIKNEHFITIDPHDDRRLSFTEFKSNVLCPKSATTPLKIKVIYKAVVKPNYFTPEQRIELSAIIKECEAIEKDLPVWNLESVKQELAFFQNYQHNLDRLNKETIISNEVVVEMK